MVNMGKKKIDVAAYEVKFCTLSRYMTTCKKSCKEKLENEHNYFLKNNN